MAKKSNVALFPFIVIGGIVGFLVIVLLVVRGEDRSLQTSFPGEIGDDDEIRYGAYHYARCTGNCQPSCVLNEALCRFMYEENEYLAGRGPEPSSPLRTDLPLINNTLVFAGCIPYGAYPHSPHEPQPLVPVPPGILSAADAQCRSYALNPPGVSNCVQSPYGNEWNLTRHDMNYSYFCTADGSQCGYYDETAQDGISWDLECETPDGPHTYHPSGRFLWDYHIATTRTYDGRTTTVDGVLIRGSEQCTDEGTCIPGGGLPPPVNPPPVGEL